MRPDLIILIIFVTNVSSNTVPNTCAQLHQEVITTAKTIRKKFRFQNGEVKMDLGINAKPALWSLELLVL
jgi:hypothetical protein